MAHKFERLYAIEGGDGSGKGTQAKLLADNLTRDGYTVRLGSFPRYGEASARIVEQYLRGEFGTANDVAPELASAAFLLDRIAAAPETEIFFKTHPNGIGIFDRYVASNAAHQGTKIDDPSRRRQFYRDSFELEYDVFGLPKPNKNFVMLVPSDMAQLNVDLKEARSYTTAKRDVHEADVDHLDKALRNYLEIVELFPDEFTAIWPFDTKLRMMRPIDDIQAELREQVDSSSAAQFS